MARVAGGWEEMGRMSSLEWDSIALDAFNASSLLAVEGPMVWAYGCPCACDCRDRVVRLTPRPPEDVFLFWIAVALLDPGFDPDGVFAATEGCRRGRG